MSEEKVYKPVGKLRHWKQRWNKNAAFIWRRPITWNGAKTVPGEMIPEDLNNMKAKLRRFWEAGVIELAEFEGPVNILTGEGAHHPEPVDPDAEPVDPEADDDANDNGDSDDNAEDTEDGETDPFGDEDSTEDEETGDEDDTEDEETGDEDDTEDNPDPFGDEDENKDDFLG